jgi:enoyl-CoA hydratase/carnithine racemase
MTDHVAITDQQGLRRIAMRRPEKKNALTQAMYAAMAEALGSANADSAIRCVVICGSPGAFCVGHDLQDFLGAIKSGTGIGAAISFLYALAHCEKPLIAAVDGLAVGVGTTMLFHCDHVVASSAARFSTPFTKLGLVPEGASSLLAPRLMGHQRAFSMLVLGRPMDAASAFACGLVGTIADDVIAASTAVAHELSALPEESVKISRRLLRGEPEQIVARMNDEAMLFEQRMRSSEAVAAFNTFLSRKT